MSILRSIEQNEFTLAFQTIVELPTTRIAAVEALLRHRFSDPDRAPTRLIQLAEATGEIVELGAWVLETACREGARLQSALGANLRVSVNVSMPQLEDPAFPLVVERALIASGIAPKALELEITESVLISQRRFARHALRNLQEMGVGVALDDFGCGFANLQHLCHLHVNRLKTDRSIIRSSSRRWPILDGVTALAEHLHIPIVAEGVETRPQLEKVLRTTCREAQGYFFSRPVSCGDLIADAAIARQVA